MRVLIFGAGGISGGIVDALTGDDIIELSHDSCDVRDRQAIGANLNFYEPDWIVNCAGVSAPNDPAEEVETNLTGSINVALESGHIPLILIASVAGLYGKPDHLGYSASKAGVISVVQSLAAQGHEAWAISPGRVDTPMRQNDYPDDTPGSRLKPVQIGHVVRDIMCGVYEPGTNVVIRKVGLDTVVVTEHKGDGWKETLRVGQPKTI